MRRILLATAALTLASCGSDGDGSNNTPVQVVPAPTPTPTPTPTPAPTPAPIPTPTATAVTPFDQLSAAVTLQTVTGGFLTGYNPPQEFGISEFGEGWQYQYDPQAKSFYVVTGPSSSAISFAANEIATTAPAGIVRYLKATGQQLNLTQPVAGGVGLRWTRFIDHTNTVSGIPNRFIAVTGVPTPGTQVPTSGTVTFSRTVVAGDAYIKSNGQVTTLDLSPSTLTASIDYAKQLISFKLTLIGRPSASNTTPLVTITGTTDFAGKALKFDNSSATYTNFSSFVISAALFGTAGAEAGGVFQYRGTNANGGDVLNLVGRLAAAN